MAIHLLESCVFDNAAVMARIERFATSNAIKPACEFVTFASP
jgi:hypothetical protein